MGKKRGKLFRRPTRLQMEQLEDRTTPAILPTGFTEVEVATGLSNATAMELAPNGDLWVLQQGGSVKRFLPGSTTADVVGSLSNVGLRSEGERGLLGIAFDPDYATNKWIYLYYTSSDSPNPHNRVSRFTIDETNPADYSFVDTTANAAVYDEVEILNLDALSSATNHNGGAIHFRSDGKLYVAVGDNANGANAQSISTRHGKILRINSDGTIPNDNPTSISGISGTTTGANRAIWAAGLRNPFTFTFQPGTGTMFINDVGQNTWEEINVGVAGRNFGWPGTEGGFDPASFPNFSGPRYTYRHPLDPGNPGTFEGYAITGGAFYNPTNAQFPSGYLGDYFFSDFVNDWINVMNADGTGVRRFATDTSGTVDLKVANDGSLYYLARNANQVFRVTFTGSAAPVITQQPQDDDAPEGGSASFTVAASGEAPLAYQWQRFNGNSWVNLADGNGISGATSTTLMLGGVEIADVGDYRARVSNAVGSATSNAATLTVSANQAPTAIIAIDSGLTNGKFIAGQSIDFSGTANDPEDGSLGASAFTWRVDYITTIASGNPAVRPFLPEFSGQLGGSFTPATTGPYTRTDVAYRITLTVEDSIGRSTTETFDVLPNVANITVQTTPAGLTVTVDGQPRGAGTVISSVIGFEHPIGAAATQTASGFRFTFDSWSDGGAPTHTIVTPATDTTYSARYVFQAKFNFQPVGVPVPSAYFRDIGGIYAKRSNGFTYGWNGDISGTTRDRDAANSPDQRYDTVIHLQRPVNPNAIWSLAVPNGTYRVRVVAGDPTRTNGVYRTNVEGVLAINGTPTATNLWFDNTVVVTVTDGRLTVASAAGAVNNRLNFIEVTRIAPAGLVGAYEFDEATGNATGDGSASDNDGTLTGGASFVAGHSGTGVAFDGLTGRVTLESDLSPWLGKSGTVAFWINTTQNGNDNVVQAPGVLGVESQGNANDIIWGWLDAAGRIGVQAGDVAGAKSANPVNDGQWHHVALTRNSTTGAVQVYVDGTLSGSATSDSGAKTTPFQSIGRIDDTSGTPGYLDATLDDLMLFTRVLSAAEIRSLM